MTYEEYEVGYSKHHTCGYPMIPWELSYASDCPKCEPDSPQWKDVCRRDFDLGMIYWNGYYWGKEETNE